MNPRDLAVTPRSRWLRRWIGPIAGLLAGLVVWPSSSAKGHGPPQRRYRLRTARPRHCAGWPACEPAPPSVPPNPCHRRASSGAVSPIRRQSAREWREPSAGPTDVQLLRRCCLSECSPNRTSGKPRGLLETRVRSIPGQDGRPAARPRAIDPPTTPSDFASGLMDSPSPYLRQGDELDRRADRKRRLSFDCSGNYLYASSKARDTGSD